MECLIVSGMERTEQLMKKRILFLITEDWYFWSHRLPVARAARNAGLDVIVMTRVNKHGDLIANEGFKLVPIGLRRSSRNPIREVLSILEIIRLYHREKPDIVHQVALKPVLYGSLAARLVGVPRIVNAIAGLGSTFIAQGWKASFLKTFVHLAFRAAFFAENVSVIFQNPEDLRAFTVSGIVKKQKTVLIKGSGVDTVHFKCSTEPVGIPTVILASRMIWDKGIGEFVSAARMLKQDGLNCRFLLVGASDPDNPRSISEETLNCWHNEGVVEWLGHRKDIPEILSATNVVVLPSYREGVPKILIEAASCGRAIVTTDVPGCREIVRHNENGLLVPPRDVKTLADAIRSLIEAPTLRASMGARGRQIVKDEFSEEIVVRDTMALYREILQKKLSSTINPLCGEMGKKG